MAATTSGTYAKHVETLAPWVAGLLLATPVLVAYYPPMTDLPFHEAAVGVLRHMDDPAMVPPGLYERNLGEPNQLFHMLAWALSYVVSTRWAVKLVVAAFVVAVIVSGARFARHLDKSPLAALVLAPIALGWLFSFGFVANLAGLAALLALLPLLDRLADDPSPRRALAAMGAVVILYFAHEAMMFAYAGAVLALAVLAPVQPRKSLVRVSPFVFAVVVTVLQARWQLRFMTPAVRLVQRSWHSLGHKLLRVPDILFPASDRVVQLAVGGLCAAVVASFIVLRAREKDRDAGESSTGRLERLRAVGHQYRWEVFAACGFAAYLAFPMTLNGAAFVYQRWFAPAFAVFALAVAPRDLFARAARIPRALVFLVPVATLFATWPSFADSTRQHEDLAKVIPFIEPGSAVAELDLGPGDPTRGYSLTTAAGRVVATRGGRLCLAFTDSPISPVVIPRAVQWPESLVRVGWDAWSFEPARDFKRFRYVLLRTSDPGLSALAAYALSSEARFVTEAGEWALFESRVPVMSPVSREQAMDEVATETLRQRIDREVAALRSEGRVQAKAPSDERGRP